MMWLFAPPTHAIADDKYVAFFQLSFSLLMIVYSSGKVTDTPLINEDIQDVFGYKYRIPLFVHNVVTTFPYYTNSLTYWRYHNCIMFVSSVLMAISYGILRRASFFVFGVVTMVRILQDTSIYNNHEYLYSLLAFVFCFIGCHSIQYSFLGITLVSNSTAYNGMLSVTTKPLPSKVNGNRKGEGGRTSDDGMLHFKNKLLIRCSPFVSFVSVAYLSLNGAVYGIPGDGGLIGCLGLLTSVCMLVNIDKKLYLKEYQSKGMSVRSIRYLQIFILTIYWYAGIAKIDDDWLSGATVNELLSSWVGPTGASARDRLLSLCVGQNKRRNCLQIVACGGLFIDIIAAPIMFFNWALVKYIWCFAVTIFHIINHYLFVIETFPFVMIASCSLFIDPVKIIERHNDSMPSDSNGKIFKNTIAGLIMLATIIFHLLIPLPCAVQTLTAKYSGNSCGVVNWYSTCNFFNWRMMTRSVRTRIYSLQLINPATMAKDILSVRDWFGSIYSIDERKNSYINDYINSASSVEDRLLWFVHNIKKSAVGVGNGDRNNKREAVPPPIIRANVWLEINGPPAQKYIYPELDIANTYESDLRVFSVIPYCRNATDIVSCSRSLFVPKPMAPIVVPRITFYRSPFWMSFYSYIDIVGFKNDIKQVLFFADFTAKPLAYNNFMIHSSDQRIEIIVLGGTLVIQNSATVYSSNTCIGGRGGQLRWASFNSTEPLLLLLVLSTVNGAVTIGDDTDNDGPIVDYFVDDESSGNDNNPNKKCYYLHLFKMYKEEQQKGTNSILKDL